MFTLVKVIDNVSYFDALGKGFHLIEIETNYDEFCRAFEKAFQSKHVADDDSESTNFTKDCYAILVVNNGSEMIPLYKKQSNYIVGESGKTFKNLTYR